MRFSFVLAYLGGGGHGSILLLADGTSSCHDLPGLPETMPVPRVLWAIDAKHVMA